MNIERRKRIEAAGWKIGTVQEFLDLTDEEIEYIDFRIALSNGLKELRRRRKLTQIQTAQILKTSQSRFAKMEKGDPSVSTDLLIRALFTLGLKKKNLVRLLL
jgi:DNA-binding XRE family transcriptional regulator